MCMSDPPKPEPPPKPAPPPPPPQPTAKKVEQNAATKLTAGDRGGVGKKSLRIQMNLSSPEKSGVNVPQ